MVLSVSSEVVKIPKLRTEIPEKHCTSNDARLQWLWNQRLATVGNIFERTKDLETRMAASLVMSAAMVGDLGSIELLLRRLEGGAVSDEALLESDSMPL